MREGSIRVIYTMITMTVQENMKISRVKSASYKESTKRMWQHAWSNKCMVVEVIVEDWKQNLTDFYRKKASEYSE